MHRRRFLGYAAAVGGSLLLPGWACRRSEAASRREAKGGAGPGAGREGGQEIARLEKSDAEWRRLLEPEEYEILFEDDTEPAFSSPLNDEKREGTYVCAACFLPLFRSADKFDSGTGWPSFTRPIDGRVETRLDFKLILPRKEYHCVRCGGHQGHVFDDGPPPTGRRWCNNGLALDFVPGGEPLPALRA